MTSDDNTQNDRVSASLVKSVASEDPPVVVILCEIHCSHIIESYTGNVTLVVRRFCICQLCLCFNFKTFAAKKTCGLSLAYELISSLFHPLNMQLSHREQPYECDYCFTLGCTMVVAFC